MVVTYPEKKIRNSGSPSGIHSVPLKIYSYNHFLFPPHLQKISCEIETSQLQREVSLVRVKTIRTILSGLSIFVTIQEEQPPFVTSCGYSQGMSVWWGDQIPWPSGGICSLHHFILAENNNNNHRKNNCNNNENPVTTIPKSPISKGGKSLRAM